MNSNEKIAAANNPTRRKFILRVSAFSVVAAIAAAVKFPFSPLRNVLAGKPGAQKKPVKMLTEDGRLVEIDQSFLTANKKRVTNGELMTWIKKIK